MITTSRGGMTLLKQRPRDALKSWDRSSKPRHGEVFDSMRISRAKFKYLLRKCRREEAIIRADILASDLSNNDSTLFWKHVSKQNNGSLKLADTVSGATGHVATQLTKTRSQNVSLTLQ